MNAWVSFVPADFIKRDNIRFAKLTYCLRKSNIFIYLSGGYLYVRTSDFRISYRFCRYDRFRPALSGTKGILCKLWSGRWLWLDLLQVTASWLRALRFHLFATVLVVFLSRLSAVRRHCPVTIFLVAGIFTLVPGAGIYWTAYYVVTDQLAKASDRGFQTLKIAVAIVLGIPFVFEFPQKWFRWAERGTAAGN